MALAECGHCVLLTPVTSNFKVYTSCPDAKCDPLIVCQCYPCRMSSHVHFLRAQAAATSACSTYKQGSGHYIQRRCVEGYVLDKSPLRGMLLVYKPDTRGVRSA